MLEATTTPQAPIDLSDLRLTGAGAMIALWAAGFGVGFLFVIAAFG